MNWFLRSVKLNRYFSNPRRNLFNYLLGKENYQSQTQKQHIRLYVNQVVRQRASELNENGLEGSLRKIDQGFQRNGRLFRCDIDEFINELKNNSNTTSSQSLLMIRCCGDLVVDEIPEMKTKLVQEIWQTLENLKVPMDISHYNALLKVYLENDYQFEPLSVLEELEKQGIDPNRITYQRLIKKYCKDGDINGATKILEIMKEKEMPINEDVFNSLILGHMESKNISSALGILDVMKQGGIEPSNITYTTLLCGLAKIGDIEKIQEILTDLKQKEISLLDADYLEIIYNLTINNHKEYVPLILGEIRKMYGYHQDAINIILKLLMKDQYDVAYQVFKTMKLSEFENRAHGNFMIRQLIKLNKPIEDILQLCQRLENDGLNDKTFLYATEMCLRHKNYELALRLFDEIKNSGIEIKPHFFWPFIINKGRVNNFDGVLDVINTMITKYKVIPNNETLRDFVIPNLSKNPDIVIKQLINFALPFTSIVTNVVLNKLQEFKIKEAADVVQQFPAKYSIINLRKPLCRALLMTKDVNSFVRILESFLDNSNFVDEDGTNDLAGTFLLDIVMNSTKSTHYLIEEIMKQYVNKGFVISPEITEKIEKSLQDDLTIEITDLLERLSSNDNRSFGHNFRKKSINEDYINPEYLEKLINKRQMENQDCNGLRATLLIEYLRTKKNEKFQELFMELRKPESGFQFNVGILAPTISYFAENNDIETVDWLFEKLMENKENSIDDSKLLRAAKMYVINDQIDKAFHLLKSASRNRKNGEMFGSRVFIWRMLNHLSMAGDEKNLNELFNLLEKNEYFKTESMFLGPLVNVHLIKDDLKKAIETFEDLSSRYFMTPMKNELCKKLIEVEDAETLQKITDISTKIHGEVNSLYDLAFSFIECNRIRQARRILETPGLTARTNKIHLICERYADNDLEQPLENFIMASKNLNHINRLDIYNCLLKVYISKNDTEKALNLWLQMQDDDVVPTDNFMYTLGTFLKANNCKVPFIIPEVQENDVIDENLQLVSSNEYSAENLVILKRFRRAIKNNNIESVRKYMASSYNLLNNNDKSELIEFLCRNSFLTEAREVVNDMLNNNVTPLYRILEFYLNKLASAGLFQQIEELNEKLNIVSKKNISFNNRICNAYTIANKSDEYLDILDQDIDQAENVSKVAERFPHGGIIGLLEKNPELIEKFTKIAMKYYEKGIISPINCLWEYYFIIEDYETAKKFFDQYLMNENKLLFNGILKSATEKNNEKVFDKLLDAFKQISISENAFATIYNSYLKVLENSGNFEKIKDVLKTIQNTIGVESINAKVLRSLNDSARKSGVHLNILANDDETPVHATA